MAIVTTFLEPGTDATQDLSFFASTTVTGTGSVSSDTAQHNTGPRALKSASGGTSGAAFARTPASVVVDSGSQISFYVRFDTLPNADTAILQIRNGASGVLNLTLRTTGVLSNAPIGPTAVDGTTTLAVNTWYRICVSYYVTNTTTFTFKVYIGGVLDSTTNTGTLTNTGSTAAQFGWGGSSDGANRNLWFDDIYIATGGASSGSQPDTGNILVTAKRPNANGTTNGFSTQIGAGGSGYGTGHSPQVNEQPLSTTNGWSMVGAGSAVTEEYNIEGASVGDVDISAATLVDYMGWLYAKSLAGETGQIIVNNVSSNISLTSSNTMFTKAAGSATYPAGSGTDVGIITDTSLTTVSLFEAGIVFAYTTGSTTTSTTITTSTTTTSSSTSSSTTTTSSSTTTTSSSTSSSTTTTSSSTTTTSSSTSSSTTTTSSSTTTTSSSTTTTSSSTSSSTTTTSSSTSSSTTTTSSSSSTTTTSSSSSTTTTSSSTSSTTSSSTSITTTSSSTTVTATTGTTSISDTTTSSSTTVTSAVYQSGIPVQTRWLEKQVKQQFDIGIWREKNRLNKLFNKGYTGPKFFNTQSAPAPVTFVPKFKNLTATKKGRGDINETKTQSKKGSRPGKKAKK